MNVIRVAASVCGAMLIGAAAYAAEVGVITRSALQWREMLPGVSFAPSHGDWERGAHGKYVRITNEAKIPMHTHSGAYDAVMISGRMVNIYDDGGRRVELSSGDYFHMAAKRPHSHQCLSRKPCFFYTYSDGLWDFQGTVQSR